MPWTRLDRKVALLRIGKSHTDIAKDCKVERSLVSHVMAGRRWSGPDARQVMEHIANLLGAPVMEIFPGSERRRGEDRRPFVNEAA